MNPQFIPQQPFGGVPRQPEVSTINKLPQGVQNLPQGLPKPNYYPNKYGAAVPPNMQPLPTTMQNSGFASNAQNHADLPQLGTNQLTSIPPSTTSNQPPLQNSFPSMQHNGTPSMQIVPPNVRSNTNQPGNLNQPPYAFSGEQQSQAFPSHTIHQQVSSTGPPPPSLNRPAAGQSFLPNQPPISGQSIQGPLPSHPQSQGSLPGHLQSHGSLQSHPVSQGLLSGQPPTLGSLPGQLPPQGSLPGYPPSQGPLPGHPPSQGPLLNRPSLPRQSPQMGHQPLPGQIPQTGHPPMPGHLTQMGHPPLPGQPPFPSTYPTQNYQLSNQMQNMSLDSQRQYPGGPMPPPNINGEGGPHMPPPPGLQGYTNGQGRMPNYPAMPVHGAPGGHPGYPQPYQQNAASQQKRLDPDQMPSPIQVMQDDQKTRSGIFCTNQKGLVPPLVTTKFVVQDQGNASPRFVRSTMYNVPITQDLMKQTSIPFGLVISPMARTIEEEYPPPVANFGELGPVRCSRCKAYMCPFMQFVDAGRRFQCLLCKATTDVPPEYFQHLDHTGQRMDRYERPELVLGTYELTATKDYCRNNTFPKPPAFVFIIDVSYNNIKSGLVKLLCSQMKSIIKNLPIDQGMDKSNMRVGFITYNSTVHFYNIKGCLAAPQMMVVGDLRDMFMPLLDGFLCTPEESEIVIDALMEQIPIMFADTRETETILLPAILAGVEALKASDCSGKLLVFHSSLPIAEAPGKLKNRDDRKLLGTEKEKTVLTPQNQDYNKLGQDCVAVGCCVDLFLFNNAYIDVATIGQVSRLSGGEVFKYTYFQGDLDGERLIADVINDVNKPIAFDAIMRVRTSTGIRPTDVYGHLYMSNTTDIELGSIDCDKGVAVEIKHDDKLTEEEGVYIQVALLYTSCSGQRRLRVLNLSLKTCSQMADLYRSCDLDTLINFFAKQSVYKLLENNPKAVKDNIVNRGAQILANYRKNCASPSSSGQLILPECMKLMPLYVNCLLKSDALSGGSDITVDDRSFVMQVVTIMDVPTSVSYFYPRLIPLHDLQPEDGDEIPDQIRCSVEKMSDNGVYLLENSIYMLLWIGLNVSSTFCQQVFGVQSASQIDVDKVTIPKLDNPLSEAVHSVIEKVKSQRHRRMRLTLVRQREKLEPIFKHFLVEDRGLDNSSSYVDFLCHMHKEIRTILS